MLPAKPTIDDIRALSQPNPSREAIGARAVHIASKMGDLPSTYRNLLPTTDDPKALAAAEAAIRSIHAADRDAHATMNAPPKTAVNLSPRQLIEQGLKQGKPGAVQQPAPELTPFGRASLPVNPSAAPPVSNSLSRVQAIEQALRDKSQ